MAANQHTVIRALEIRNEVAVAMNKIGRRGYNGEKLEIRDAERVAEHLINLGYIDIEQVEDHLDFVKAQAEEVPDEQPYPDHDA